MAILPMTAGGGMTSLKDYYRDKVLNGGLTSICTLSTTARATFNEGGVVADTANRKCYLYVDFSIIADRLNPSDYSTLLTVSGMSTDYLPKYLTNSRSNMLALSCDESSTRPYSVGFGYGSSGYRFIGGYGQSLYANDSVIVYASWNY